MRRLHLFIIAILLTPGLSSPLSAQTTRITSGSSLPATCVAGNIYEKTGTSAGFYRCRDGVWTLVPDISDTTQPAAQPSYIVSGGQVVWVSDYIFNVSAATYYINGTLYTSAEDTITLTAADATDDRIDVIAVDNTGAVVKIDGTAAAQPSEPDVDPGTQLKLAIVLVTASTTEPPAATSTLLYADDAGSPTEWDWTASGGSIVVNSTNNPRSGTNDIEGTTVVAGVYAQGQIGSGSFDPNTAEFLVLYIRSKATWNNNRGLQVSLRDTGALKGTAISINRTGTFGFSSATTGVYQQVAIPITAFGVPFGTTINQVRIADFGGSIGFYLDDISFQGNASSGQISGITQTQADARYRQLSVPLVLSSATDVSGDLPYANLAQGSALSVLGVAGNATADNASIAAGTDKQVLRRSGTAVAFGAVDLSSSDAVANTLPIANGGTNLTAATDDNVMVGNGTTWQSKALTNCAGANQATNYDASTNAWGCATITAGSSSGGTTTITGVILPAQGRLTLTSGSPWMTSTATAQTTVYYTPAVGAYVPIYDGSSWNTISFTELSQATTDATKSPAAAGTYSNYDVFVWNDSGTLRATRGPAWTQAQTFTVTIASPAVFSLTGHGFYECEPIVLSTTGALPTGLTAGTTYFVIAAGLTANAFEVSATCGGSAINTSGTQSGTHTATQNTTVRGTGAGTTELHFLNGILTNVNTITNGPAADRGTYVGTVRTNGSSQIDLIFGGVGAAGGESTVLGIWNMYNRSPAALVNFDNTDTWNYTLAAFRIKDGNVNNRIQFLVGYRGDAIHAFNNVSTRENNANIAAAIGIGLNSMTTLAAASASGRHDSSAANSEVAIASAYTGIAPLGFNYIAPLELSGSGVGTRTWNGDAGGTNAWSSFMATVTY